MRCQAHALKETIMLTLFHAPRSRSSGFLWLLEETGAAYDVHYVSIMRGDGSGASDTTNPHPHGKVPLLRDGDAIVFEQTAIALYVADKFPDANLGYPVGDKGRGQFVSMLSYYSGVTEPAFLSAFLNVTPPRGTAGWVKVDEVMEFLNAHLAKNAYIAGDKFTAADVPYAGAFALFMDSPIMTQLKTLQLVDYVQRCTSRPAFARAKAKDSPPA